MPKEKRNAPHILAYIMEIDKAIRNGEYPNTNKMNQKLGWSISRSTFGRYIDILRDTYNAPAEYDFKKNGYYYTDPTYFMKQVMLKEGDLLSFSIILPLLEQYKNTPLEGSFRGLMQKITQMLPESITIDSALINDEVNFISEPVAKIQKGVFETVLKAAKLRKTLSLEYKRANEDQWQESAFDPYRLICQKGSWYLLGFSHRSEQIRIYAMPRIRSCKVTQKRFTIPQDFRLERHIDPQMGLWNNKGKSIKVELEFSKELKNYVTEREWHSGQKMRQNKDGTVYLSFSTNQITQTATWILSFAGACKVLNPPELKEQVVQAAKKILEVNG